MRTSTLVALTSVSAAGLLTGIYRPNAGTAPDTPSVTATAAGVPASTIGRQPSSCDAPVRIPLGDSGMVLKLPVDVDVPTTDPRQPGYDPIALQKVNVNAFEIFDLEPIDPQWAPIMEEKIAQQLRLDLSVLAPTFANAEVLCHWATCRLSVDVEHSDVQKARGAFTVAQYGDRTTFSRSSEQALPDGRARESCIVLFHETRDLDDQARVYADKRRAFMKYMSPKDPILGPLVPR
jgi:hypothetical protein